MILTNLFQIQFQIHSPTGRTTEGEQQAGARLVNVYYSGNNHYEPIIKNEDDESESSDDELSELSDGDDDDDYNLKQIQAKYNGGSCNYLLVTPNGTPLYLGKSYRTTATRAIEHPVSAIITKNKFGINLAPKRVQNRKRKTSKKSQELYSILKDCRRIAVKLINRHTSTNIVSQAEAMLINYGKDCKIYSNKRKVNLSKLPVMKSKKILRELEDEIDQLPITWYDLTEISTIINEIKFPDRIQFTKIDQVGRYVCSRNFQNSKGSRLSKERIDLIIDYLKRNELTTATGRYDMRKFLHQRAD